MKRAHVIGAGLAGLSAAVHLARAGISVTVHEASPHAGGRCRSFVDPVLNTVIDNGAHLMLSGNTDVKTYLDLIGATQDVIETDRACFEFFDMANAGRWRVDLGHGRGSLSVLGALMRSGNRPPKDGFLSMMKDMNALKSGQGKTVAACVGASPALETFWQPLTVSVLNAEPDEAAATLLWRVLAQTVLKGGALAKPLFTRQGLGAALIDPALVTLARLGADVRFGSRVQAMDIDGQRIRSLDLGTQAEILGTGDLVVLAVPHFVAQDLLPGLSAPTQSRAILNVHFKLPLSREAPSMIGLVHARAQWIFVRGDVASVTISAAEKWMDQDADAIASAVWPEVVAVLGEAQALSVTDLPPHRVIKERRATFAQTPSALTMRPQTNTSIDNLFLAGDWTATDLPATIEGALKSGRRAAEFALKS